MRRWLAEPQGPEEPPPQEEPPPYEREPEAGTAVTDEKASLVEETALPLDDRRWLPIREAHRLILERARVGDAYLAARDLTDALQTGEVPSLRRKRLRSDMGPERQVNTLDYLANLEVNAEAEVMRLDFPADPTLTRSSSRRLLTSCSMSGSRTSSISGPCTALVEDKTDKTDMSALSCRQIFLCGHYAGHRSLRRWLLWRTSPCAISIVA